MFLAGCDIAVDAIHDDLVNRFVALASQLEVGPADENPDFSALTNQRARDKSLHYIDIGRQTARLLAGGSAGSDNWGKTWHSPDRRSPRPV